MFLVLCGTIEMHFYSMFLNVVVNKLWRSDFIKVKETGRKWCVHNPGENMLSNLATFFPIITLLSLFMQMFCCLLSLS